MGPFLSGKKQGPSVALSKTPRGADSRACRNWRVNEALGVGGKFCPRFYAGRAGRPCRGVVWGILRHMLVLRKARRGSSGRLRGLVFCRVLALCGTSGKKGLPCTGSPFLFIKVFCAYIGFCLGARIRRMLRLCSSNVGLKTWRLVLSATKYKLLKLGVGCNTPKTDS